MKPNNRLVTTFNLRRTDMNEEQLIKQIKLILEDKGTPSYVSLRFLFPNSKGEQKEVYLRFAI